MDTGRETNEQCMFSDRKWILQSSGFVAGTGRFGLLYRMVVLIDYSAVFVSLCVGAILSTDDINSIVLCVHFGLILVVVMAGLLARHFTEKNFDGEVKALRSGLFHYEKWEGDEAMEAIKTAGMVGMKSSLRYYFMLMTTVFVSFTVGKPAILKLFLNPQEAEGQVINPYLPLPLYMPFDTHTRLGYVFGCLACVFPSFLGVVSVASMEEVYVGSVANLTVQFQLLNHSLRVIRLRAQHRLQRGHSQDESFYSCLRENARHHQAILRSYMKLKELLSIIILLVAVMASTILAVVGVATLWSLQTGDSPVIVLTYIGMLSVEGCFVFRFCFYGEQLTHQGVIFFQQLYNTPWPDRDQKFKYLLLIMLGNAMKPISPKAAIISFYTTYESFSNIISTMYQILNLVRNSTAI